MYICVLRPYKLNTAVGHRLSQLNYASNKKALPFTMYYAKVYTEVLDIVCLSCVLF